MLNSIKSDIKEAGIDEAGRGCLMGPVYTAAVILPTEFSSDEYLEIRDSKKLSKNKRNKLRKYIEEVAISWSVDSAPPELDFSRPFIFIIRHVETNTPIFIGKLGDPS